MDLTLFIHLIAIGVWMGCVATEVVCEIDQKNVYFKDSYIASLHWRIDKYVELPAILISGATGYMLLQATIWTPLVTIKIGAGMLAVVLNVCAAYTIKMRYKCFLENDEEKYLKYHLLHERIGIGCVASILVAIISGGIQISN